MAMRLNRIRMQEAHVLQLGGISAGQRSISQRQVHIRKVFGGSVVQERCESETSQR